MRYALFRVRINGNTGLNPSSAPMREGFVAIAATARGLRRLTLPFREEAEALAQVQQELESGAHHEPGSLSAVAEKVALYFSGEDVDFADVTMDVEGRTHFQKCVLEAVRAIPRGSMRTYGEVAAAAGRPLAARAVGAIMASNPLCLVVPCHRVIGSTGSLVGFGGGLELKRLMLVMEGVAMQGVATPGVRRR